MTNDIEALNDFKVVDKPTDIGYETPYLKIARACQLLANEKAIELPVSFFNTKNFKPSISNAGKRIGIKIKTVVKNGVVFIFKR